jgi:hypothetical protein
LDPVTRIEAALVSVTVRVTVCPEEMLLELALIETVGMAAAALAAHVESATKVTKKDPKDFISSHDVHSSRLRSGARCSFGEVSAQSLNEMDGVQRLLMHSYSRKEATKIAAQW